MNKRVTKKILSSIVVLVILLGLVIITGLDDRIFYGEKEEITLPMKVIDKRYNAIKKTDYVAVDWNGMEYNVLQQYVRKAHSFRDGMNSIICKRF